MTRTNSLTARVWRVLPISLILVLAAVLRLRGIGHDSLWGDEALTILLAKMSIPEMIKGVIAFEQIPPVHHLVVHLWMQVFGDSEASVRMPSAIAGIASVYIGYVLVSRLVGRRIGLITALLMATSPMLIAYSQECRAYSMAVLFGLWSCDLFIRLMRRPTQRLHVMYVLVSTLLIYTHVYGLFTILAQVLIYAWRWWRALRGDEPLRLRPREIIIDGVAVVALYSPWIPVVRGWTKAIHAGFWVKKVTFDDIARAYWTYSGSTAAFMAIIALVVIGVWSWSRYSWKRPPAQHPRPRHRRVGFAMLLALMFVPVVVPVTISVLTRPSFAPRYAIISTVGMLAIAAIGIAAIRPAPLRWMVLAAVAALSPLGNAAVIPRAPWREVGQFLQENVRPGDLVVLHLRAGTRLYDYYVDRPDVRRVGMDTVGLPVMYPFEPRRVWLVVYDAFPWYTANMVINRHPVKIGRRKFTWGVMALELIEDPEKLREMTPTTQSPTEPAAPPTIILPPPPTKPTSTAATATPTSAPADPQAVAPMKRPPPTLLAVVLILVVAAIIRARGIGHDSLWGDEALSVLIAKKPLADVVPRVIDWEQIPPVHHVILHFWIKLFGDSETSVRVPSLLAGVAGVFMAYVLVARLIGRRAGLIAALLLAVSPIHVVYAQECRAYALGVLLGLWSCDAFVRLLRRPSATAECRYVVLSTLLLYTHVYGLFTILAQQMLYVWRWARAWRQAPGRHDGAELPPLRPRRFLLVNAAIAALYAPFVPVVVRWTRAIHTNFWVQRNTYEDATSAYWTYAGSSVAFFLMVPLVVLGSRALYRARRRSALVLLLALMLVPVLVPVTVSVLHRPSFAPRYAIIASVAMLALAAAGLAALRPAALRLPAVAVVALVTLPGDAPVIYRAPWREAGAFLNRNMRPTDTAIVNIRAGTRLYDYYVKRPDVRRLGVDINSVPVSLPLDGRRVWLVLYGPIYPANEILGRAPADRAPARGTGPGRARTHRRPDRRISRAAVGYVAGCATAVCCQPCDDFVALRISSSTARPSSTLWIGRLPSRRQSAKWPISSAKVSVAGNSRFVGSLAPRGRW